MRRFLMLALVAMALFSCKENEVVIDDGTGDNEAIVVLNINVQGRPGSRAVEPGHDGANDETATPQVHTVSLMAYDTYDNLLTSILLDDTQMSKALYGQYTKPDGTPGTTQAPAGATIGVPKGTAKVDVVINAYSNEKNVTNINFFNYREGKDGSGNAYTSGMETSYARVPLVSDAGKVSLESSQLKPGATGNVPTYTIDFTVVPSFARIEVYGGINVAEPKEWVDYWNNRWFVMTYKEFVDYVQASMLGLTLEKDDDSGVITLHKMTSTAFDYGYCGAIAATKGNGFSDAVTITDDTPVYLPEYYYIHGNTHTAPEKKGDVRIDKVLGTNIVASVDEGGNVNVGKWIKNPYVEGQTIDWVKWNPNVYYAVDVEEVFVNNIKVASLGDLPFLMPWPGSEAATHWPDWYRGFHLKGWHTLGVSTGHTFKCMGNMWDRIAQATTGDAGVVNVPGIDANGGSTNIPEPMAVITNKAAASSGKSKYYATDRNLGIETGKAAGYQIYHQSTLLADIDANKDNLGSALPHIILKVKAYKTKDKYTAGTSTSYEKDKQFVTMKLFKKDAVSHITNFAAGNIFRLDIASLLSSMVGPVPIPSGTHQPKDPNNPTDPGDPIQPKDPFDPDPEMPGANVEVTIDVIPWTIQNITPDI